MGAWGTGLYSNDCTSDVRDTYIKFLEDQFSNEDAYLKTIETFLEIMGTDEEPLFWYALAETQWKLGRLKQEVKKKALDFINEDGGLELWEESKKGAEGWRKSLVKLKEKLESPQPKEKIIKKPIEFERNPWNLGDVYAYMFHTDISKVRDFYGKFILFQKIGEDFWYDGRKYSIIQVFDKIFDYIPETNELEGVRILPLFHPPGINGAPSSKEEYVPNFNSMLRVQMICSKRAQYPIKNLYYVGNKKVSDQIFSQTDYSELSWEKDLMDSWLIDYYLEWQNIDY